MWRRVAFGVLVPVLAAAEPATCVRSAGDAASACIAQYLRLVEDCRKAGDAACEVALRADGGELGRTLDATFPPVRDDCSDADADSLDFVGGQDDIVRRMGEACAQFGDDHLAVVWPQGLDATCQKRAAKILGKVRAATTQLFGRKCFLKLYDGKNCNRRKRDRLAAALQSAARRKLANVCPDAGAMVGTVFGHARHFAQFVYPPNDLGPTADLGEHPVGVRTIALADAARMNVSDTGPRPVVVEVYYPSTAAGIAGVPRDVASVLGVPIVDTPTYRDVPIGPGTLPVILFSHANGGIRIQSLWLMATLASHGYVVVTPDHHGNTVVDLLAGVIDAASAFNRPLDMTFLIDQLGDAGNPLGAFAVGHVDLAKLGMSGHSFGGFTSFALAGDDTTFMFRDARVKAIMPQAPLAPFSAEFLASITVPTLIVGGTLDTTTPFDVDQQAPFDGLVTDLPFAGLAAITDAGHFTFSDICEVTPDLAAVIGGFSEACEPRHLPWRHAHDLVSYLAVNFFDAVLQGDADALGRLDPEVLNAIDDMTYTTK